MYVCMYVYSRRVIDNTDELEDNSDEESYLHSLGGVSDETEPSASENEEDEESVVEARPPSQAVVEALPGSK